MRKSISARLLAASALPALVLGGCSSTGGGPELAPASFVAMQEGPGEEYVIGPLDELTIHVWRNDELNDPPSARPADFPEEHRMQSRITELDPPNRVVLVGSGSGVSAVDTIEFARTATGTTVDYTADIRLEGVRRLVQPLLLAALNVDPPEGSAGLAGLFVFG